MSTSFARNATVARGFAINRAHPDQNQKFHLKQDPNPTPEKQENLGNLQKLSDHEHPLYVQPQADGTCIVPGTITGHPPKDGYAVSSEHIPSKGIALPAHEIKGTPQFGMPFTSENVEVIPTNLLTIGPEIAPTGSALEAELMKEVKKELIK